MQSSKPSIDIEKNEMIKKSWDQNADMYNDILGLSSLHINVMLYSLCRSQDAKRICEVGTGPGEGSMAFINSFLQPGAQYYNSDISDSMITYFSKKFSNSLFSDSLKVKYSQIAESSEIAVPYEEISEEDAHRYVYATVANNECLPYPDECFDLYLANLSLMLVSSADNMLKEAFRVTQKGATLGFTTIGRISEHGLLNTIHDAMVNSGNTPPPAPVILERFGTTEKLKAELENAGFENVKSFATPMVSFMTVDEAYAFCTQNPFYRNLMNTWDEEAKNKLKQAFDDVFEKEYGKDSLKPLTIEIIVSSAKKP